MTTAISKTTNPKNFEENKTVAKRGGNIAKNTRLNIEKELGKSVISPLNAKDKERLEIKNNDYDGD